MFLAILLLALFLSSCANKGFKGAENQSVAVLLRLDGLRLNELGFLYSKPTRLELYKLGKPLLRLLVREDKICLQGACFDKLEFNKRYFKNAYYEDFLEDILLFKPIFSGQGL